MTGTSERRALSTVDGDPRASTRPLPFLFLAGTLVLAVFGAGCAEADAGRVQADRTRPDTVAVGSDECGLRRVAHRFGVTDLEGDPRRVVPLSFRDQDAVLALGEVPAAVQDGFYAAPYLEWPWVRSRLGDARPHVLSVGEVNFEEVAALRPDLILGAAAAITGQEYRVLERIAPTVAQLEGFVEFGVPWQASLRAAARSLCREAAAEQRIAQLEGELARVRERYPWLSGATAAMAMTGGPGGAYWVLGPDDSRGRFMRSLGLRTPAAIDALAGDRFVATVSAERLDLLDVDVLVWIASAEERAHLESNPIYRQLDVVREGRVVYLEPEGLVTAAVTNTTALNLPFLLDELAPRIAGALRAGDGAEAATR